MSSQKRKRNVLGCLLASLVVLLLSFNEARSESSNIVETRVLPPKSFLDAMKSDLGLIKEESKRDDLQSLGSEHKESVAPAGVVRTSVTKSVQVVIGPKVINADKGHENGIEDNEAKGKTKKTISSKKGEFKARRIVAKEEESKSIIKSETTFNKPKRRRIKVRRTRQRSTTTTTTSTTTMVSTTLDDLASDWRPIHMPQVRKSRPERRVDRNNVRRLKEANKFRQMKVKDPYRKRERRKRFEADFTDALHPDELAAPKISEFTQTNDNEDDHFGEKARKNGFEDVVQDELDEYRGPIPNQLAKTIPSNNHVAHYGERAHKTLDTEIKGLPERKNIIKPFSRTVKTTTIGYSNPNIVEKEPNYGAEVVDSPRFPDARHLADVGQQPRVLVRQSRLPQVHFESNFEQGKPEIAAKSYVAITRPISIYPSLLGDSFWRGHTDRRRRNMSAFFAMIHDQDFAAQKFAQISRHSSRGVPRHIIEHISEKVDSRIPRKIADRVRFEVEANPGDGAFVWKTQHPVQKEEEEWLW